MFLPIPAELFPVWPAPSSEQLRSPTDEVLLRDASCFWMQFLAYEEGTYPTPWPYPMPLHDAAACWKSARKLSLQAWHFVAVYVIVQR